MKTFMKYAVAAALTGAIALAAASPSEARNGRNTAAAIGFGAGALVGAAAASSYNNGYYREGYYAEPGYAYHPGYAYERGYAYEPAAAPVYIEPGPSYYSGRSSRSNTRNCTSSPGSQSFGSNC